MSKDYKEAIAQELFKYATPELHRLPFDENAEQVIPYRETSTGLVHFKDSPNGTASIPLTNFVASIVSDTEEDDGAESRRVFTIRARVGDTVKEFNVSASRFSNMQWVLENLGTSAIVYPGKESHAKTAIQMLSKGVEFRQVFTHTGWRELDGSYVYLHAGDAIDESGLNQNVSVSLNGDLSKFLLPEPPRDEELCEAIRASLNLTKTGPVKVTVALLAAAYRAPLGNADFSEWVGGGSGAGKSVIAALAQAHFGAGFTYRNAPGNWSSTDNALEALAFAAKDAVLMIDDYAPTDKQSRDRLNRKVDRVIRAQGNQSGRQRQNADGTLRSTKPPRGLIVSTGEDVPPGKSLRGRLMIMQLDRQGANALYWLEVSRAQKEAAEDRYASAMAGYIQWLAPIYSEIRKVLPAQIATLRALTLRSQAHARTPENSANLGLGLAYFLRFAVERGAISEEIALSYLHRGWKAISELSREQAQYQDASDPVTMFVDFITSALATGKAHVASREDGSAPLDAQTWGWKQFGGEWSGQGLKIGWIEGEDLYLEPNAARAIVQEMSTRTDSQFVISASQLHQQLYSKGLLLSSDHQTGRQTYPVRRRCEGRSQSVLHFSAHTVGSMGTEKPDISDNQSASIDSEKDSDVGYLSKFVVFGFQSDIQPDNSTSACVGSDSDMPSSEIQPDTGKANNGNGYSPNVGFVGNFDPCDKSEIIALLTETFQSDNFNIESQIEGETGSSLIPDPLPIDVIAYCYNGPCGALLEFKQGRAYCPRCGVYQRIVA